MGDKRQTPLERDFYKLANNVNFGIDCRSNISNCKLEPIYNEISEINLFEICQYFK